MEKELYEQILNLAKLKVDNVEITKKTIHVKCHIDEKEGECPSCQRLVSDFKSYRTHTVRDLDIYTTETGFGIK
jgi:hypothetical protein